MKKKILAGVLSVLLLTSSASAFAEGMGNFNWNNSPMKFSDVPQGAWYYNDVSKASASGIINGIGNGKFNPDGTLTHAEAMTLMAKVHAIYNGKVDELNSYMTNSKGSHWADGVYDYCKANGLSGAINKSKFDEKISRGTMATYFRKALPTAAYTSGHQNDLSLAPEAPPSSDVRDLFKAGIMIGDGGGFRFYDSITRAEAAAIIHRVANPDVRVKVEAPEQPSTPVTPPVTNPGGGSTTQPGQVQSSKPYKNIPHTNWQSDPTGGVTITSQSGYINTKYGNHTYGCTNQQEYDKVMSVMDEAFNYAVQQENTKDYRSGIESLAKEGTDRTIFYQQQLGITNKQQIISMRVTENFVYNMKIYLTNTYAKPNGAGTNSDKHNTNVYKYLFAGGHLDCDGSGNLNMLCWDYLGFSTRMIGSTNVDHAAAQVYVNGQWVMLKQGTGRFDDTCTHKQLLELMSGKTNDAHSTHKDTDAIIRAASSNPSRLSDLQIDVSPTHNPSDRSVK